MPITDDQIRALQKNASALGDSRRAAICKRALEGDPEAREECARVMEIVAAAVRQLDRDLGRW